MGARYEIQVLDSYDNKTYFDGQCGAVYNQRPPMVNACRKPGEWQTYDIVFTAPRFDAEGKVVTPAYVTVLHNGVLVQNHTEMKGDTYYDRPNVHEARREAAAGADVPRQPGALPQHLDPRDQGAGGQAGEGEGRFADGRDSRRNHVDVSGRPLGWRPGVQGIKTLKVT